jgi:NAD(P)-dependent dehydrogenase (short-subunit alcohol dehydrogenase family)
MNKWISQERPKPMSDLLLKGKVAVVTGAGRGIGKAIAISSAKAGVKVIVNAVDQNAGHASSTVNEIIRDVSDFEQAKKLIQTALSNFGRVDILVNNAGISGGKRMPWEMSEEEWDRMISIHLKGTFNCTRHVCSLMKEQRWGRIINCTSGSWISRSGGCHYAAAKAGIVGFTRAIAMDMELPVTPIIPMQKQTC